MFIQFFYVQKKDNNEVFLYIIKYENNIENLNENLYTSLYDTNNVKDINYTNKFYLKKGFKINYNSMVWNQFLSIKLENLDLISLIDIKKINKYYNTDILHFNYNDYKIIINSTITKLIINKDIID